MPTSARRVSRSTTREDVGGEVSLPETLPTRPTSAVDGLGLWRYRVHASCDERAAPCPSASCDSGCVAVPADAAAHCPWLLGDTDVAHSASGNAVCPDQAPAYGMFMPDVVKSITIDGTYYFLTANEGGGRR